MPVMGPCESEAQVEQAYEEVKQHLLDKYKLFRMPTKGPSGLDFTWHNPDRTWAEEREIKLDALKEAIRRIFRLDSYEGF